MKEDDLDAAYESFLEVIEKCKESEDSTKDDWAFKAKKQMIKTLFEQGESKRDKVLTKYKELLSYLENGKVTSSYAEKSFTNMLDHLTQGGATIKGKGPQHDQAVNFIEEIYNETLKALVKAKNDRMWIKTNLKLATFYTSRKDIDKALGVLTQVQDVCLGSYFLNSQLKAISVNSEEPTVSASAVAMLANSSDENNVKSSYLIEVYAQMISLYSQAGNYKKVKEIYKLTEGLASAVTHPRILGVIREAGGKMHMREKRYELARQAFFDSFKNYDEAGSLSRISVLKYYVLACMLSETKINPFESQETRPYRDDPQINTMVQLVDAFQKNDTEAFQRLLTDKDSVAEIQKDKFIKEFVHDIELSAQALGILKLVKPYSRVRFSKLAESLNISEKLVKEILTFLILDTKLPRARLDYQGNYVELHAASIFLDPKTTYPGQTSNDAEAAAQGNAILVDDSGTETAAFASARGIGIPGGIAPLVRAHQTPETALKLTSEHENNELDFPKLIQSSLAGRYLLSSEIIASINESITTGEGTSTEKSGQASKSQVHLLNDNPTYNDIHSLFDIPKRYKQAIEESETVAGSKKVTTEGAAGAAPGSGPSAGGAGGATEAVPSVATGTSNAMAGAGGDSAAGSAGLKSADSSTRAGSINSDNPYAWATQEKMRSVAILSWAKSVGALQQITQKGEVNGSWVRKDTKKESGDTNSGYPEFDLRPVIPGAVDIVDSELIDIATNQGLSASSVIWANTTTKA